MAMEQRENYPKQPIHERAERIERVREELNTRPSRKLSGDDQVAIAEDLHSLLRRIEKTKGIQPARVLREAHIGGDDPAKYLAQYAIRPGAGSDRLRKKVRAYYDIARAAAKLAEIDEGEALLEVFHRAEFWQTRHSRTTSHEFADLSERLRRVMDAVAAKHRLTEYFNHVRDGGGILTPTLDCFHRELEAASPLPPGKVAIEFYHSWDPQNWPIEFWQPATEVEDGNGDHIPAYPLLILGAWRLDPPFSASITADDGNITGTVEGVYEVELSLCIVPIEKALQATPALRVHATTSLSSIPAVEGGHITFSWGGVPVLKPGNVQIHGRRDPGNQDVLCSARIKVGALPRLLAEYFPDLTSATGGNGTAGGVRFLPIRAGVCEHWFDLPIMGDIYDPMTQRLANRPSGYSLAGQFDSNEFPSAEFRYGTLADVVHRRLCDPVSGIDFLLRKKAEILCDLYENALRRGQQQREQGWECVRQRWGLPSSTSRDT
jgi:hypothetical protein